MPGLRGKLVVLCCLFCNYNVPTKSLHLVGQVLVMSQDDSDFLIRLQSMILPVFYELSLLLGLGFLFAVVTCRTVPGIQYEDFGLLLLYSRPCLLVIIGWLLIQTLRSNRLFEEADKGCVPVSEVCQQSCTLFTITHVCVHYEFFQTLLCFIEPLVLEFFQRVVFALAVS